MIPLLGHLTIIMITRADKVVIILLGLSVLIGILAVLTHVQNKDGSETVYIPGTTLKIDYCLPSAPCAEETHYDPD